MAVPDERFESNDTTFRAYSPAQVQEYARRRGGYPQKLIDEIVSLHSQTGGSFECLLDLGCGPGNATRDLAQDFENAIGIDPSAEMISSAKQMSGAARSGPIRFIQDDAERCKEIPDNSVDVIASATAAHWFDMDRFWPTAARIVKPNGTVAFFTIWRIYVHPMTTPCSAQIQRILFELEQETLGPYQKAGNWNLMGLYKDFQMPWSLSVPCSSLPESTYRRQIWNEGGVAGDDGSYVCGERSMTLEETEQAIATISSVTRWREAHPQLANTNRDCVKAAFAKIRGILRPTGTEKITMVGPTVLVTVKKK